MENLAKVLRILFVVNLERVSLVKYKMMVSKYKQSASDHDENRAKLRVAGLGIDGGDTVLNPLEWKTLHVTWINVPRFIHVMLPPISQ